MALLLKPGQVLGKDIKTVRGTLLVPQGTRLTVDMVTKLKKFFIDDSGIASECPIVTPHIVEVETHEKTTTCDAKISNIETKVDSVKHIFTENINPKEVEEVAVDTAADIVEEVAQFNCNTNICINDLRVSDEYTYQHSVDVAILATMLGKNTGLNKKQLNELAQAGLLHDIGKQRIPKEILNKPARLTSEEMIIMRTHSQLGYELALAMPDISEAVRLGILQHHEKVDGSGYPYAITPPDLSLYAKILSIADIYDALTHKRCYKPPMSSAEAFGIMANEIPTFDTQLFVEFFKHITFYPLHSEVILNDGTIWTVVDNTNAKSPKVVDATGYMLDLAVSDLKVFGIYSEQMMAKWRALHT